MLQKYIFAITASLFCNTVIAQQAVPAISNLRACVEAGTNQITIRYDVEGADSKDVRITFQLLPADAELSPISSYDVYGDVGYPVKTGRNKLIVCSYSGLIINISDYKVRLVAEDLQKPDIGKIADKVNIDNIRKDIFFLSSKRYFREDSLQLKLVIQKIEKDIIDNKLTLQKQEFVHAGHTATNMVAMLPGVSNDNRLFIVGAHWDAVKDSPGSDDNASGVAGMLEMMRVLSKYQFHHSVYFVGFDMEEEGLLGSKEFVSRLDSNKAAQTGLVINMDMIGYYSAQPKSQVFPGALKDLFPDAYKEVVYNEFKGDFILNTMNEESQYAGKKFDSCASLYVPELKVISLVVPDDGKFAPDAFRASDHASFWDADMKATSIGDTGDLRNFNYHTSDDVMDAIDLPFIQRVVKAIASTIAALAGVTNATTAEAPITLSVNKPDARIFGNKGNYYYDF